MRELGAGGMGVVFAAEDVRLGRQVAIKFVPDGVADDRQLFDRLRSEARTASALNHPNICTLYDIGDHDGRPFLVMELLQGRTLRDRLMTGPLKTDETIDIGIQVADALDTAHREHIIHRDIKPANLFLSERGPVKILDFGLAKYVSHQPSALTAAPTDLTSAGMTLGTVAYMSPEQVTGDPLDARSDLFSFGVVLYECVTGHQPFKGKTSGLILSEILNRTPPSPLTFNPDLPLRLQEIITNCLEKDRELRYQDAAALRTDIKRLKRDLDSGPRMASRIGIPIDSTSSVTQPVPVTMTKSSPTAAAPQSRRGMLAAAIAGVLLIATAAAVFMFRTLSSEQRLPTPVAPVVQAPPAAENDRPAAAIAPPATPPSEIRPAPSAVARKTEPRQPSPSPSPTPPGRSDTPAGAQLPPETPPVAAAIPPPVAPVAVDALKPLAPPAVPPPPLPAPAAPAAEDDDSAIRRLIAAYAHAIETKDLGAFRSVKPNLSGAEQRRLEDSFRSVASQKVDINVLAIERRGPTAVVKVKRRDTLTASGRSQ
ncbi:MAG TPA: serine/threonine-protein kinase, partial [Vicinamibacterales bacterium]|nr:serine/threonine-protein kinase [Vicinamibacterales bacterium]